MSTVSMYEHVMKTPGVCGGKPCVADHRIRVQDIACDYEQKGMTPDQICDAHPGLALAQVHAALAYFFDHRDEVLAEIRADREFAESFQRQHPE